jgi:hypothetical protein
LRAALSNARKAAMPLGPAPITAIRFLIDLSLS